MVYVEHEAGKEKKGQHICEEYGPPQKNEQGPQIHRVAREAVDARDD